MRSAVRRLTRVLPSAMLGAALALTAVVPAAKAAPVDAESKPWAAGDKTVVVDESTITTWEGVAKDDTANVGRIWTDKSVFNEDVTLPGGIEPVIKKDDSDFLVGLSALSSTSNTKTTSTSVQPLDIALVLDVSGSMGETIETATDHKPTYKIDQDDDSKSYYAKLPNGKFKKIDRITKGFIFERFDHWELDKKTVVPKKSEDDPEGIQFYTATVSRTTRLAALKNAAYGFIDSTAKANGAISNPEKQHRVSIVSFSSDASIVQSLTACTDGTKDGIKRAVGRLSRGGDTYPGKAMEKAVAAFRAAPRTDARKVVVFFTDGNPAPAGTNDFNVDLADSGVTGSKRLKDDGATVYSIGIFEGADPSKDEATTNNRFNAYMHAMSSNYPKATKWNNLGTRAENSDYYKAATDADELNSIFQEISNEINSGTGSPTETTEGMASKSGYITFTDELGAYMQVDEFKTLVFADTKFDPMKSSNGLVDTYTYSGTVDTELYPKVDVSNLIVQVKRSNDLAQGDIVTVKIPATLIPLRNFKVTTTDAKSEMAIGEAFPLRIFYGVSIKPGVRNAVLGGTADDALRAYIKNNSEGGKTAFYSNFYNGMIVAGDKQLGNTTATFVPSKANSFYYFTEDTALYTDGACAQPLRTEPVSGETYYYKRAYYKQNADGKTATKDWAITQFKGANFDALTTYWGKAPDGTYFIKAGSPRLTRIDALTLDKKENLTGTATEVINPRWDNINNPHEINVNLGNNGKLSVEMPGSLAINKDARIAPGKNIDPSVLEGKQFKFEISIPSAVNKTLKADIKNAQGEVISKTFGMTFDNEGKRLQDLQDNETLTIYGLDANTEYTVTEKDIPAGFTQTDATGDTGTITANEVAHAKFENTYDVAAAKPIASDSFVKYQKDFDKWEVADAFDIQLQAVQAGNPMPKGSIYGPDNRGVKIAPATQQHPTGSFGDIVFDRPGTFEYTVSEVKPAGDAMVPGVTYSQAVYKVTVVVEDNGDGTLKVASNTMTRVSNDAGGNLAAPEEIVNKTAVFANKFNAESTSAAPVAHKRYTNHGGEGTALKSDMFTFKVESKTPGAPLPEGADPDGDGALLVKNQGEEIPLAQATFGAEHVGNTYVYDINEIRPDGATADNNYTVNGMTYDPTVYRAKFQVTSDGDGDQARVKVAISYYKVDGDKEEPLLEGQTPEFNNSYDPADVTLPSDPNDAPLRARKTLVGRDSKQDESFTFELSAADNPTVFALENDVVVFNGDASATTMTASVSDLKNGQAKDAPFEKATFTKPGTYKFNIKENAPADGKGMTYDRTTHEVTVVVTDENGVLKADVKYAGAKDAAAFTNKYEARYDLDTGFKLDVTKTLDGRAQEAGEFGFKIEGVASNTVTAAEASKRLDAKEAKFETVAPADNGVPSLMENKLNKLHFTQADAGKTFSYVLCEDIPADDKKLGGVTYDETTYRIDIQVVDNANGTMGTVTTITKNADSPNPEKVGPYNSADGKDVATLDFTNAYAAQPVTVDGTKYDLNLYKKLEGRDWRKGDTFHFVMKAGSHDDPGAQKAEVDVAADPGTKAGKKVPFNFGGYTFTQPGEYYYTITEVEPAEGDKIHGITYSKNAADIVVSVIDNLKGQLEAKVEVKNGTFTNTYKAELDHNAAGGLIIAKTTNGHDMAQGQFKFQVQALDDEGTTAAETAKRLGMEDGKTTGEFGNVAGKDGERVAMTSQTPLKFTQADVGKSFVFKVSEFGANGEPGTGGKKDGYTYSDAVYTIGLSVKDNFDGTLKLTTMVTEKGGMPTSTESSATAPVATEIDFVNSYAAETTDATDIDLATAATKTLDGRNMKAGEFSFEIVSNPIADQGAEKKIATGENAAADSGKPAAVTFDKGSLSYTLEQLKGLAADKTADRYVEAGTTKDGKPQYTVHYTARELTDKLPTGVAALKASFDFTVTVVDNGDGTLAATANYPKGGLAFTNTYSWQPVVVDPDAIKGAAVTKVLKGDRATDLADGEFEFRMTTKAIAGSLDTVKDADGKAWPATKTATNKADGSVDFGKMGFSAAGTYEVTIKEVKGDAAHMTYDGHEFTYTIKVAYDPSTGKLSANVEGLDPAKATFTNVYFNAKDAKDVTVNGADKPQASVDGKLVGVGDELVYTIDWVNNAVDKSGTPVAANVTVTDKIPHGTEYVSASEGGKHENGAVTWKLDNQPAGASGTVTLTVRVTDDAVVTGSVENQASIQIGDNKVATNVTKTFVPGKSETTHPDSVKPGETVLSYQIKFHNTDGADATATVVDKLGEGLEYQAGSARVNGEPVEPAVDGSPAAGTTLTWNLSKLDAGQDVVITFNVKVAENGPNTVENQATVNEHETNVETTPFPTKDVKHVYKGDVLVDGKLVGVGETLTFKIDWWHDATLDKDNSTVTVVDKLPDGMKPKSGTISDNGSYDADKGTITWTIENAAGKHGTVAFDAEVTDAVIEAAKRGEVTNIAKVNNHASQSVSVNVPTKTVAKPEGQSGSIKVGDEVVYTINYKNTEDNAATVTITDVLPKGITYKPDSATPAASYDEANRTLTWTLADVASGGSGSVSFTGVVNEDAIKDGINNNAGIQLGENGPVISTNTESTKMGTGDLTISKKVKSAIAGVTAPDAEFTFDVTLTDAAGNQLAGTYSYEGAKQGAIANGNGKITLKHGQSVTIKGLPEGAKYKVVERKLKGFTAIADTVNGAIHKGQAEKVEFINTYTPAAVVIPGGDKGALQVKKVLKGRDWLPNESYSFELQAMTEGAPMPEGAGNIATAIAKKQVVSFGGISFAKPGAYEYRIVETGVSADTNLTFSKAEYKLVVTVKPNGAALTAASVLTQVKDDAGEPANKVLKVPGEVMTFTNTYKKPAQGKDVAAEGKPGTSIDGQLVQVGSRLVYTIDWVNDAVDETGKAVAANVTITDKIPTGTAYDEGSATNGGVYNADTNTLTWSLGKQEANASGTVIFTVEVTEAALNNKVENQANIQIGENKTEMTSKPEVFVPGKKVEDANKGDIQVGDVLTYTVSYANPGKDFATVTITDKLPKGLTYVDGSASGGGSFDKAENKLTWKINDVKAGATGTVTFEARVNESALTNGIANTANVQLGDHTPVVDTNTTPENLPKTSTLKIGKTIKLAENQGTEIDEKKEFSFKITLTDAAGNPLNEDYRYSGEGLDGGVIATGKDGDTFKLKHGQAITIQGLPVGAKYTITEDDAAGYTPDKKTIEGVVSVDGTSQAAFVNTYSIGDGVTLAAKDGFKASKELVGRDWNGTDKFSAKLMSVNGAPMPDGAKDGVLVKQMTKDSKEVSFGDIKYTAAGEYTYTISEEVGSIGGIKYSDTIYNVKVKVTDKGDGTLAASFDGKYVANGAVEDAKPVDIAKFVNVYSAAVPQGSPVTTANLFSKVLTGRDWKKDDSFTFTITPLNGAPAPEHLEATLTGLTNAAGDAVPFDFGTIGFTFDHIKDVPVVNGVRTKDFVYEVRENVPTDRDKIAGVTYDTRVATLTITLTDDGSGVLSASSVVMRVKQFINEYTTKPINPDGDGATAKAGIQIVKTLTGRPIAAGDFKFTMAPADDATKAKFGDAKVIATNAAELGTDKATSNTAIAITPVKTGLEFTLADVGKTYTFDLIETKGGGAGYVNDETKHTLTFTTADNDNGTLSVTATLDGKEAAVWTSGAELIPVSVGFANSYSAGSITVGGQGGVALAGTKQLTGRPMVAGEFHFNVTNAKNAGRVVATGTNAADGTITFTGIKYTTEKLNNDVAAGLATVDRAGKDGDVYTYTYKVSEDAGRKDKGVSIVQGEQTITVKVTDNRAGKLSAKVVYPEGGMVFKNAYGTGEGGSKQIALNGTKVLDVKSGNKVPDIAGKYTFTLAGSEGAPMPAKTTATNDASGNISFGEIIYTMENVFGAPAAQPEQLVIAEDGADTADAKTAGATDAKAAEVDAKADDAVAAEAKPAEDESAAKAAFEDEPMVASAQRSKTFTYTVTESGSVAGVSNDPVATKTIKVKVTDNGDGTLTVDKQAESNKTDFTFTNTYSVKPFDSTLTGKGGFAITKTLDGRDLREGEFEFALVSQGEGEQTVVTAKNDANGKVVFPAISFNEPGEYRYRLAEVDGGLGGVTYDTTVYDVTAKVVDNGDGTLDVTWSVSKDGKALEGKEIVFANSYKAAGTSITFNAAKVLTGRELKKGEFTFELRDANGKVLQTVKNGALTEGGYAPIAFDPIAYDEPGTYDYRIVEVKGDAEGITYDETVFTYHVVVTDDGNGQLQVEWTVGETGAPVFQNVFVKPEDPKPADPAKPANPGNGGSGDKLIQTGDNALVGMFAAAFAGMAAIGVGFTARRKKK